MSVRVAIAVLLRFILWYDMTPTNRRCVGFAERRKHVRHPRGVDRPAVGALPEVRSAHLVCAADALA